MVENLNCIFFNSSITYKEPCIEYLRFLTKFIYHQHLKKNTKINQILWSITKVQSYKIFTNIHI